MKLLTTSSYRALTGENTTTDAVAGTLIDAASQAVLTYLNRELEFKTRRQWITLDGSDPKTVWLPEWPVKRVRTVGGAINVATLTYSGDADLMPTYETTTDRIVLMAYDDGEQVETILNFADYPKASQLKAAIDALTDWGLTLTVGDNYPSRLFKPNGGSLDQDVILTGCQVGARYAIEDELMLELEYPVGSTVYVAWDGGYAIPEDDNESSSSSDTDPIVDASIPALPADIQMAVANVARDMYTVGKTSGGVKFSETITNYQYSIDPANVQVSDLVNRYASLLDKYRRIDLRG